MFTETTSITILAVDDSPVFVEILNKILTAEGYKVITCSNGPEGRELAKTHRPNLILLDLMMEGEDGLEVIKKLKGSSETSSIPIIFLTGKDDIEAKVECFELGAVDYILKPFYDREVLARVRIHLQLNAATNALISSQAEKLKQIHKAQKSLLIPPDALPKANFGVYYSSLQEAGGDLYDVLSISENIIGYFVGDVAGHDIETSYLTASLKALLKQNCSPFYNPVESMCMINEVLLEILPADKFITACYIRLNRNTMRITLINAGHPPVLYLPVNSEAVLIENKGDLLGIFSDVNFDECDMAVTQGDRFFIFTDGLIERTDSEKRSNYKEDLKQAAEKVRDISIRESVLKIKEEMLETEFEPEDDVVILGFEV